MKRKVKPVLIIIPALVLFVYGGWWLQVLARPGLPERVKVLMTITFLLTVVVMACASSR